jgi:hypothetical protein
LLYKVSRAKHELYILSRKITVLNIEGHSYSPKEARKYIKNTFHLNRVE